jgi:hemin uptake protein HemP
MSPIPDPIATGRNPAQTPGDREPRRVRSDALLRGGRRLIIDHAGASYTLFLTRNGKLILTK